MVVEVMVVMMFVNMVVFMPLNNNMAPIHIPGMLALYPLCHLLHGQVTVFLSLAVAPVTRRRLCQ